MGHQSKMFRVDGIGNSRLSFWGSASVNIPVICYWGRRFGPFIMALHFRTCTSCWQASMYLRRLGPSAGSNAGSPEYAIQIGHQGTTVDARIVRAAPHNCRVGVARTPGVVWYSTGSPFFPGCLAAAPRDVLEL